MEPLPNARTEDAAQAGVVDAGDVRLVGGAAQKCVRAAKLSSGGMGPLDEGTREAAIRPAEEREAASRRPVPASPTRLLIVRLECARQLHVNDRTDVGLVDAHPEGIGGRDDAAVVVHEGRLNARPFGAGQPGVVRLGANAPAAARRPASRALATWSSMSDTRGVTTSVRPPRASAGT